FPFAGRSNPISERLLILASDSSLPEQSVSHQVTIHRCDGTSPAEWPTAIQHLCSFAGQLGRQKVRLQVSLAFVESSGCRLLCLRDPAVARRRSIRRRRCDMNKTNIEHPTSNAEHRSREH